MLHHCIAAKLAAMGDISRWYQIWRIRLVRRCYPYLGVKLKYYNYTNYTINFCTGSVLHLSLAGLGKMFAISKWFYLPNYLDRFSKEKCLEQI